MNLITAASQVQALAVPKDTERAAHLLAHLSYLRKAIEDKEKDVRDALADLQTTVYVPDVMLKVLRTSRDSTEYHEEAIGKAFQKLKQLPKFFKIVKVMQGRLKSADLPESLQEVVAQYSHTTTTTFVTVQKLNADEAKDFVQA